MAEKTVECRECGWEGIRSTLEQYKCPNCGSRKLRTEGSSLSQEDNLNPPSGADDAEDMSAAD